MSKYIIKNCENLTYCPSCKEYECSLCLQGEDFRRKCSDNLDCLLKQIVGKCQDAQDKEYRKGSYKFRSPSKAVFGREILQLMDIEEVE